MTPEAFRERFEKHVKELREQANGKQLEDALENGLGEPLAARLLLLATRDPSPFLDGLIQNGRALAACRDQLEKLATAK